MTDFKTISGRKIKFLTSDLTMSSATEGELFYSDSDKEFKVGVSVQAWASGGNMNTGRRRAKGAGTQTAGLIAGGHDGSNVAGETETYDGSSWTEVADLNTDRQYHGGCGTQTAALMGGDNSVVESWDGSSSVSYTHLTLPTILRV